MFHTVSPCLQNKSDPLLNVIARTFFKNIHLYNAFFLSFLFFIVELYYYYTYMPLYIPVGDVVLSTLFHLFNCCC